MACAPIVVIGQTREAVAGEQELPSTQCGWAGCTARRLDYGVVCDAHAVALIQEPLGNFSSFLEMLPFMLNVTIAGRALYHAVDTAVHLGLISAYLGLELMRLATASRNGAGVEMTIARLVTSIRPRDQGEFLMHLKRQLLVPERRGARRD